MTALEALWVDLMAQVQANKITIERANEIYHEAKEKQS